MKRIVLALAVFSTAYTAPAMAQNPAASASAPHTKVEQELLDLSRTKWRWMAEKKADTLATLFHDDAIFVHMGGAWGRTQEVDIIRSGGIHYKHAEIFEASVKVMGSTAIVFNRIRLDAVVGGNEVSNPFFVTETYVQQGGSWKLAALAFTRQLTPGS
jgi:hypothetical protein